MLDTSSLKGSPSKYTEPVSVSMGLAVWSISSKYTQTMFSVAGWKCGAFPTNTHCQWEVQGAWDYGGFPRNTQSQWGFKGGRECGTLTANTQSPRHSSATLANLIYYGYLVKISSKTGFIVPLYTSLHCQLYKFTFIYIHMYVSSWLLVFCRKTIQFLHINTVLSLCFLISYIFFICNFMHTLDVTLIFLARFLCFSL